MTICACMHEGCAKAGRCLASSGGRYDYAELLPIFYERTPPPRKDDMTDTLASACMTEQAIDEYLSDYTMDADPEFHVPTDAELALIKDAIMGLLVDQNFLASFAPLAEPELRAGIALQLREIERLRMQVKQADEMRAYGDAREAAARERYYAAGWIACASWAKRDDLLADIDSPAYIAEFENAIRKWA